MLALLDARRGHFRLESGHHGDVWLDLDALFLRPSAVRPLAAELGRRLAAHGAELLCGPLVGGAFVAQLAAADLGLEFAYAERVVAGKAVAYRVPASLRDRVRGRRAAVVDDVVNAGSAAGGTLAELRACGAEPVALGALLVLGTAAARVAAARALPLESLAGRPSGLWAPAACPLCAAGVALEDPG